MHRTLAEHLVTWLRRSCVDKITLFQWTILLLELWHSNACSVDDHISVNQGKRSGIIFSLNKFK